MRLPPKERHIRTLQNIERLALQDRRRRLLKFKFRRTKYYKASLAARIFFILFTIVAVLPIKFQDTNPKQVFEIDYREYYTGKWIAKKHSYEIVTTNDGYKLPVEKLFGSLHPGDSIVTFRNLLFKKVAILQYDEKRVRSLSGDFPTVGALVVIAMFSIMTMQENMAYNVKKINSVLGLGAFFITLYLLEYFI